MKFPDRVAEPGTVLDVKRAATVHSFRAWMRRRDLAAGTIEKRCSVVRRWWDFIGSPFEAAPVDVDRWLDELEPMVSSSRYGVVSHLHAFYRWAMREGLTATDPTALVDRPRLRQRLPRPIHPTDLDVALLTAGVEMRCALLLAATSGLRCVEIARLRWDDVHDGRARVLGKGSRERVVPLHPVTVEQLEHVSRRGVHVLEGWQAAAGHPGLRVSQLANAHLRSLGISSTMHSLRHYAGTEALRASGGNLRQVQDLLGHASPATTALYAALDPTELVSVVAGIRVPGQAASPAA
jgi:integrase/recombinase XerC